MRNRVLERIRPIEMIEARATAEAKPLPKRPARLPEGWGRGMLDYLHAQDTSWAALAPRRTVAPESRDSGLHKLAVTGRFIRGQARYYDILATDVEAALAELAALAPLAMLKAGVAL